jgi:hypothetical protein
MSFREMGENTSLYFQLWQFLLIKFLALLILKLKLKEFFYWLEFLQI